MSHSSASNASASSAPARSRLLDRLLSDDAFLPAEPRDLAETGLSPTLVEGLIVKLILALGSVSGREIADRICLPFRVLEGVFHALRQRQWVVYAGSAQLNDYHYRLTDLGSDRARSMMESCSYVGPSPVPLTDYVNSVEAQTVRAESPQRAALERAFSDISIEPDMFETMGPAINSGAGLFLYGAPGNGKTTIAQRVTQCFGQDIWLPHAVVEDGYLIKVYDAAYHERVNRDDDSLLKSASQDLRWVKVKRPTVVVGGELTMDSLEIRHDPVGNVCEASLQMKSNCGCLLIDDFGRQRMEPTELLNRWIVPLENRIDFLTIPSGKKIQVPFEQLIIFSTNLDPSELTDDAFLRRIPYKIEVRDPSKQEFIKLFGLFAEKMKFPVEDDTIQYLIKRHYVAEGRSLRRCHPRDLLQQIRNYCVYNGLPMEMRREYFDRVVRSYFTVVSGSQDSVASAPPQSGDAEASIEDNLSRLIPADAPAPLYDPGLSVVQEQRAQPTDNRPFTTSSSEARAMQPSRPSSQAPPQAVGKPSRDMQPKPESQAAPTAKPAPDTPPAMPPRATEATLAVAQASPGKVNRPTPMKPPAAKAPPAPKAPAPKAPAPAPPAKAARPSAQPPSASQTAKRAAIPLGPRPPAGSAPPKPNRPAPLPPPDDLPSATEPLGPANASARSD